jgi:ribonuclease R
LKKQFQHSSRPGHRFKRKGEGRFDRKDNPGAAREPFSGRVVGVIEKSGDQLMLRPTTRKNREIYVLRTTPDIPVKVGDVVLAEVPTTGRLGQKEAKLKENLGPFDAPQAVSMMAIAHQDIPFVFPPEVIEASEKLKAADLGNREDLRKIPLVTIDGADARDFDDAVFAESDADPKNAGGFKLIVAIADVSHYVKSGSVLDREAYKRGNSVYFPDRVVPMLPEALSNDLCSLKPHEPRACMVAHMTINAHGELIHSHFTRGLMRSAARLTYERAQKAADGHADDLTRPIMDDVIRPLYAAYAVLAKARKKRGTLELEVMEREIKIGADGRVSAIGARQRLESHKLIEEFMILANVAAADALQKRGMAGLYRVHDAPSAEKLDSLRGFLKGYDIKLPQGQNLRPADLARVLEKFVGTDHSPVINEIMLRSQAQATYSPENIGHFGLSLARYAHFTSPIRRYADLVVHRALIRLFKLGDDGLSDEEMSQLEKTGEHISVTERRAIDAEREASDRYTSLYLASKVGDTFEGRISGVTRSGLFVRLNDTGADGFIAMNTLPDDYYHHDPARHSLTGKRTGKRFRLADKLSVKLVEADPVVGGLRFEILGSPSSRPPAKDRAPQDQDRRKFKNRNRRHRGRE